MTKRKVMIQMLVSRIEFGASLFGAEAEDSEEEAAEEEFDLADLMGEMPEPTEMVMEGRLITGKDRIELVYEESELTGMEGSVTSIGFDRSNPSLISMMRTGPVSTVLTFEESRRHICVYNTPFSDFEICVRAISVENKLLGEGTLTLDYLLEIHGAEAEHCKMSVRVRPLEE
ncbi:MAG: DUF1934 domain-containing protein [Clostridia bacterium]|nr:DUF1934 domain-containing protein [Clostridia bacterium]